jgi:hypothetical protein
MMKMTKKEKPILLVDAMPEAFALRRIAWQLFATLTFRSRPRRSSQSKIMVFSWLRGVAGCCRIHFKRNLLWLARCELGRLTGNGHYHLCLAGLPVEFVKPEDLRAYKSLWWQGGGGFAKIESYNPARDGVGYILKLSDSPFDAMRDGKFKHDGDDCVPTLSDSLIEMMRRRSI